MSVREAILEDAGEINILSKELGYNWELSLDFTKSQLKAVLDSRDDRLWVFEEEGALKGWIHCFIAHRVASPSFVEIGHLTVSSKFHRKGIGRALVARGKSWAKELNLKLRVRSNVIRKEAHKFYESTEFKKIKEQIVFEYV